VNCNPKVLIILATYNGSPWIIEQVDSILNQKNVNVQLLIVDDASTDDTIEIIEEKYGGNNCIKVNRNILNSGFASLNFISTFRLVNLDSCDYVAYCDQDDIWFANKLSSAINVLKFTNSDGYSSSVMAFWPDNSEKKLNQCPTISRADFLFEGAGQGCSFVLPVDKFRRIQEFCKSHYQLISKFHFHDWLTYLLFRTWGYKWCFDSFISMKYRQHYSNDIGAKQGINGVIKRLKLIRTGWYKNQVSLAISIYFLAGGSDKKILEFKMIFELPNSIYRKAVLCHFILLYSRRSMRDRICLFLCSIFGWI
jgi:rhamnosyltransferase